MPYNISKITTARNIFHSDVLLKGDLKVQFGGEGLNLTPPADWLP